MIVSVIAVASPSRNSSHLQTPKSLSNEQKPYPFLLKYTTKAIQQTMAPALEKSPSSVGVVLRDASHFTQKSSVKPVKDKSGLSETDLTNTVSLDLDDPEVKEAARNLFLKDPTLAARGS